MTIYTKMVRIKNDPNGSPPRKHRGIQRIWHYYDPYKKEQVMQLVGSDLQNGLHGDYPVYKEDIEAELNYLSKIIVQDAVRRQKETPLQLTSIECFCDNPRYRGEYDHIKKRFKFKHELKIPVFQLEEINRTYEKRGLGRIEDIKGVIDDPKLDAPEKFKRRAIIEAGIIEDGFDIQKM